MGGGAPGDKIGLVNVVVIKCLDVMLDIGRFTCFVKRKLWEGKKGKERTKKLLMFVQGRFTRDNFGFLNTTVIKCLVSYLWMFLDNTI